MKNKFKDELEILLNEYKNRKSRVNKIEIEQLKNNNFVILFKDESNNLLTFSNELKNENELNFYLLTTFSNLLMNDILFKKDVIQK